MQITSLEELFKHHLGVLYSTETQLVEAIPLMLEKTVNQALKTALNDHLAVTKTQVKRLEQIAMKMNFELSEIKDEGLESLLRQEQKTLVMIEDPELLDNAIMGGTDKVEHYEMAFYNGVIALADKLDLDEVSDLLNESYDEEKTAARAVEGLASGGLIAKAVDAITP